ncbi:hypothetical protein BS78_09G060400 [Paspalum vaginatum]|nr:hypothetical protein BS78_09G060400 [Paspalum vaginatum]
MDLQEHHDLIFGEEFCFPVTTSYYPPLCAPTGINVPAQLYQHQTISTCDNQALNYAGHQGQGTSCMYYVVPDADYGITFSPHGPQPLHPCAIGDGRFVRNQDYCAETVKHTYQQPVPTSYHAALPSVAERTPDSTAHSLAYTNGLFVPDGFRQNASAASERGAAWNHSQQQVSTSSIKFQGNTVVPREQPHRPAPWKRQFSGGAVEPARLHRARQSPQVAVPSVRSSPRTNLSYKNQVSNVGSGICKMLPAERSQQYARTSSHANRRCSSVNQHSLSKAKTPIGSMSSEIIAKSYTSKFLIGSPDGKIVIRTDRYNRDGFKVVYPNAKFFVIKSFDESDIHKSIKYGVWSSSFIGNQKLDIAFREAQAIAASSCTLCPVFLFFSVNGSSHFCGVAEMVGPVDYQNDMDFWCKDRWVGSFPVKWHIIKNVPNSTFRSILLQNNEDKPVTTSRDTQEIYYTPGTTMLKLFKYTRAEGCLLDDFMMHEEEEARSRQHQSSKLRRAAPHFIPTWHGPRTNKPVLPKSDSIVIERSTSETNNLTDKLHNLNLDRHHGSWQDFGNLTFVASTTNTQKESYGYGIQESRNTVKAIPSPSPTYQPVTSNRGSASGGEQRWWKKAEVTPNGKSRPETAASVSLNAPLEKQQKEGNCTLVHSASGAPEMTCEEQKIVRKPCSPAVYSTSKACSKPPPGVVAIGSMLVPITMSS